MPSTHLTFHQQHILQQTGLTLNESGHAVLTDFEAARRFDRDLSLKPIAATAWTLTDPTFARDQLGAYTLADFVRATLYRSDEERDLVAMALGIKTRGPYRWQDNRFCKLMLELMEKRYLFVFFQKYRKHGPGHWSILPCGYDWDGNGRLVESEMALFQGCYEQVYRHYKMFVATLVMFYRGGPTSPWLEGIECNWHIVDVIETLRDHDMLEDWSKLVVLCPGW